MVGWLKHFAGPVEHSADAASQVRGRALNPENQVAVRANPVAHRAGWYARSSAREAWSAQCARLSNELSDALTERAIEVTDRVVWCAHWIDAVAERAEDLRNAADRFADSPNRFASSAVRFTRR